MIFKVVSFHPTHDGAVLPRVPLFVEVSTWFTGRRIVGAYLKVPSDDVLLELYEAPLPVGAEKLHEYKTGHVRLVRGALAARAA